MSLSMTLKPLLTTGSNQEDRKSSRYDGKSCCTSKMILILSHIFSHLFHVFIYLSVSTSIKQLNFNVKWLAKHVS